MKNLSRFIAIVLLLGSALSAEAISSTDHIASEGKPVRKQDHWPDGVFELVNDPLRTEGWRPWFSEWPSDVEHYGMKVGSTRDINHLLAKLAKIKAPEVRLLLDPGKQAGPLGFTTVVDKEKNLAAIFSIGNQKTLDQWFNRLETTKSEIGWQPNGKSKTRTFGVHRLTEPPKALPPTLTLYVGHPAIQLNELEIRGHVSVAGDISKFYREHHKDDPLIKVIDDFVAKRQWANSKKTGDEAFHFPELTKTQRVAIVDEANRAFAAYNKTSTKEIPKKFWGETMRSLEPVRVVDDRVNIKIVLAETGEMEAGFYVNIPISSYLPESSNFLEFVRLSEGDDNSFGQLYRYRSKRQNDIARPANPKSNR